eukprot:gene1426-32797_t
MLGPDLQLKVIPSKVPLSQDFNGLVPHNKRYSLRMALDELARRNLPVGLVLDLTNSDRYYRFSEEVPDAEQRNITYHKVRCRGRGESPSPENVNFATFEIYRFFNYYPDKYVFVHCTHGFNRSGYIIVCALIRMMGDKGMSVSRAVRNFAESRPPGIYKPGYLTDLFKYHHEKRDLRKNPCPQVPSWKGGDANEDEQPGDLPPEAAVDPSVGRGEDRNEDEQPGELAPKAAVDPSVEPSHDKIFDIGEPIPHDEAAFVLSSVCTALLPERPDIPFPGSQPVSLARANLELIRNRRYWVTWKADGTRYMMWIDTRDAVPHPSSSKTWPTSGLPRWGASLWHTVRRGDGGGPGKGITQVLQKILVEKPWKDRYAAIESDVIKPRNVERAYINGEKMKGYDDMYKPLTCEELLKWKFSHLNSVDFKLRIETPQGQPQPTAIPAAPQPPPPSIRAASSKFSKYFNFNQSSCCSRSEFNPAPPRLDSSKACS